MVKILCMLIAILDVLQAEDTQPHLRALRNPSCAMSKCGSGCDPKVCICTSDHFLAPCTCLCYS
ncbi:hypothetical protein Pmar_PMAR004389 [Perkinsus marinus ATCC 50983]|uniref:Uncharacterized protein n=1 Tax=Perkinsus marinus (strain ATCC 50983 / TXsc) TaxID=423536 RepID=C5KAI8_PERM5|nr:hypothetical protein Pmar_PMAR004389 [Perkinsus marinus ATCC 50983]EER18524.1 hypothetical protein Pmar_PMAR004389 [Perkinsus marinus ATCC 50983]|eukprot:XP_002786728.1 hypothetical protein Pmar_PMAR004389 [Perkinsus marinus ATCC 50983]